MADICPFNRAAAPRIPPVTAAEEVRIARDCLIDAMAEIEAAQQAMVTAILDYARAASRYERTRLALPAGVVERLETSEHVSCSST